MSNAFKLDVGILNSAPPHWERRPLWTIVRRRDITGRPEAELLSVYREHGVIPRKSRDDNFNKPSEDLSAYRYVRPGDLVLNKMKTWQGSLGVSQHEGIVSPAYFVCEMADDIDAAYAHHLLRSEPYIHLYQAASKGIRPNQWDLPFDEFRQLPVLLPPLAEQRRIAEFLDAETIHIDTLAQLRERQIGLVEERYGSALEDAFCKRIYRPTRLKHLLASKPRYGVLVPRFVDEGVRYIRVNDLLDLPGRADSLNRIPHDLSTQYARTVTKPGDVLLSVVGTMGRSAVVPPEVAGSNVARAVASLRPLPNISAELLSTWLNTPGFLRQATEATGSDTAQPTLGMEDLANFELAWPLPGKEQDELSTNTQMLQHQRNDLVRVFRRQSELLNERRQALITAAVTGQFDVSTASGRNVTEGAAV